MKKYYLQPSWDVIPRDHGVDLILLSRDQTITLADSLGQPSLKESFTSLRWGLASKRTPLLSRLLKLDVISFEEEPSKQSLETNDYLTLLHEYFVGPGNLLSYDAACPIAADTFFANKVTIAYSLGFGPRLVAHQSSLSSGWGADPDPTMAHIKAIVEGVERYALADYDLTDFPNYSRKLESITGSDSILVPLDALHHPVDYNELGRLPICPMNISGVAGHQTKEAAITNGILELCEHEALMVTWFGKRNTPTIRPASLDPLSQKYIHSLEKMGWQIILKNITLDLTPVVMAIALGPPGKRALTIGACAAFSSKYAVKKALSEVIRTILVDEATSPTFVDIKRENVNDIFTHSQYYAHHTNMAEAAQLWAEGGEVDVDDLLTHGNGLTLSEKSASWEMNHLKKIFQKHRIDLYATDITPHQVKKSNVPLVIMRVLAPQMAFLAVGYNQEPTSTERFEKLLKKFGKGRVDSSKNAHPFS